MIEFNNCPSTLLQGYNTYSSQALKALFEGKRVSPILGFDISEFRNVDYIAEAIHRISVSGVQEKFPAIIKDGEIVLSKNNERSTHILKPAPWDKTLMDRKLIPANEHVTMQIASQIYGIITSANGLCFTIIFYRMGRNCQWKILHQ
jgi:serine/threonine-protein kinase HipA